MDGNFLVQKAARLLLEETHHNPNTLLRITFAICYRAQLDLERRAEKWILIVDPGPEVQILWWYKHECLEREKLERWEVGGTSWSEVRDDLALTLDVRRIGTSLEPACRS